MTVLDIDVPYYKTFLEKNFASLGSIDDNNISTYLQNMNLMKDGIVNLTGALLFGKNTIFRLPAFCIKTVAYPCEKIDPSEYLDSRDIAGKIEDVFRETMGFFNANLRHVQNGQGVNSLGVLEIPVIVFEELVVNAILHRDYFISSPIRIFIYTNRVEIISPGHLPNNLTIENIKRGNSNIRNPVLASYATRILPYRGLGSGIIRALEAYPDISFEDDHDGNMFKAVIKRHEFPQNNRRGSG